MNCSVKGCKEEPTYRVGVLKRARVYCEKHFIQHSQRKLVRKLKEKTR